MADAALHQVLELLREAGRRGADGQGPDAAWGAMKGAALRSVARRFRELGDDAGAQAAERAARQADRAAD